MRLRILLLFALVAGLMAFNIMPSYALTTITIEDLSDGELVDLVDGNCQLREALQAIGDGSSDPDTSPDTVDGCTVAEDAGFEYIINFSASGTLVMSGDQFAGTMPEVPSGYNVTIDGGNTVTIDPPPGDDAFNMDSSRTMTFTNLIFTGDNNTVTNDGQAITNDGGNLIINAVTFTGLSHDWGAAIRNSGGVVNITNSNFLNNAATSTANGNGGAITTNFDTTINTTSFTGNSAVNLGGAIYISGDSTTINGGAFTGNIATSGDDNEGGGAIFIQTGDLSILGTAFVLNQAADGSGGAIYINSASDPISITGVTFDGNLAGGTSDGDANGFAAEGGGAIYVIGDINVQNSAFVGNIATNDGGGILFRAGAYTAIVNNSTFSANIANSNGGGVYLGTTNTTYDVTLSNVTIAQNSATTGSGGGFYHVDTTGWGRLFQTLIADNVVGGDCEGEVDQTAAGGYNLIQNAAGCTGMDSTDLINVGADLGPFAVQFYPLGSSSPAIDGGRDFANCSIIIDQVGAPRPQDGDSDGTPLCDIGAIEMIAGTGGNDAPVAVGDAYNTDQDTQLDVPAPGVLGNDSDADGDPMTAAVVTGVSDGTLTLNTDGSFSYDPDLGFTGTDSFTYQVSDGAELSNIATVTITINTPGNDAPVAVDDDYTIAEEGTLTVVLPGVLGNDTDVDGDPLTAVLDTNVGDGTLTLNPDGSFEYIPDLDFVGTDSFTYFANDGTLDSALPATVTIMVTDVNDVAEAFDDNYITDEGVALNIAAPGVLSNDTDVDGDTLSAFLDTDVSNGVLALSADGSFSYTPNMGFSGTDDFTYFVFDGSVINPVPATVTITVTDSNIAPVAVDDVYATVEETQLTIPAPGVLTNDTDADGNPLTAVLDTDVSNGTLTLNPDGSFIYMPNVDFDGIDSFTYTANDGTDDSNIATVTITVAGINDAPVAVDDAYNTDEGVTLNIPAPGVLGNDTDAEGDTMNANLVTPVSIGTLTLNPDGSFEYIPAGGPGVATFTYFADDGALNGNTVTVTITINSAGNDAPVAVDDAYMTDQDVPLNVLVPPGVLGNDTDADGDPLTAVIEVGASNGAVTLNSNGTFTYQPIAGFFGTDSFTYRANDGTVDGNVATVTITVNPAGANTAPVATDDAYVTDYGTQLNIAAPGVLGNDTDADGDPLTASLDTGPSDGILVFNANGSFSYTPTSGFSGTDDFTYHANDGTDDSNVATVTITVNPNTAPVAVDDGYVTDQDVALNIAAPGVLGNDTDADGNPLTASLDTGPSDGILVFNANGSFSYTPNAGFFGTNSFTYHATDGTDNSNVVTVTITVNLVGNAAPVANDDAFVTDQDVVLNIVAPGVLANDTDPNGDMLFALLDSPASNGLVTINPDGSFSYTPDMGFFGTDSFTYSAFDGSAISATPATVTITVNPAGGGNNPPVANNDAYSVDQDTILNVAAPGVLANDTDADGDPLTAVLGTGASNGVVTLNPDGSFSYTPTLGFFGADSFTYMANDGTVDSSLTLVSITVNAPGSTPDPVVIFYPTPDPVPLCADISGETNSIVRADIPQGAADASVFCRVLVENGNYEYTSGAIGNLDLLNRGVRQAVDVFALGEAGSVTRFNVPVTVCLLGSGDLFYMDATQAPRVPQLMPTFMAGGYTCASIPNAGTLVLVG